MPASPVFLDHQVRVCGECHKAYLATYEQSVHGSGLIQVRLAGDRRVCGLPRCSRHLLCCRPALHVASVQRGAELRQVPSFSGGATGDRAYTAIKRVPGTWLTGRLRAGHRAASQAAPTAMKGTIRCARFAGVPCRVAQPLWQLSCGLADRYRLSLHGELTEFGYLPAAECADCHGAHDIRRLDDPASHLAGANRVETCRKCHANAVANFATVRSARQLQGRGRISVPAPRVLLAGDDHLHAGGLVCAAHAVLVHTVVLSSRTARPRPSVRGGKSRDHEFREGRRVIYVLLIVSFVGSGRDRIATEVRQRIRGRRRLAGLVGGFQTTSIWHRTFAVLLLAACVVHLVWLVGYVRRRRSKGVGWRRCCGDRIHPCPTAVTCGISCA